MVIKDGQHSPANGKKVHPSTILSSISIKTHDFPPPDVNQKTTVEDPEHIRTDQSKEETSTSKTGRDESTKGSSVIISPGITKAGKEQSDSTVVNRGLSATQSANTKIKSTQCTTISIKAALPSICRLIGISLLLYGSGSTALSVSSDCGINQYLDTKRGICLDRCGQNLEISCPVGFRCVNSIHPPQCVHKCAKHCSAIQYCDDSTNPPTCRGCAELCVQNEMKCRSHCNSYYKRLKKKDTLVGRMSTETTAASTEATTVLSSLDKADEGQNESSTTAQPVATANSKSVVGIVVGVVIGIILLIVILVWSIHCYRRLRTQKTAESGIEMVNRNNVPLVRHGDDP